MSQIEELIFKVSQRGTGEDYYLLGKEYIAIFEKTREKDFLKQAHEALQWSLECYSDVIVPVAVFIELGRIYEYFGSFKGAIEVFSRVMKQYPNHELIVDIIFMCGVLFFRNQQIQSAIRMFDHILAAKKIPSNMSEEMLVFVTATMHHLIQRHSESHELFLKAYKASKPLLPFNQWFLDHKTWASYAHLFARRGDHAISSEILKFGVLRHPQKAELHLQLAQSLKCSGQYHRAAAEAENAMDLDSDKQKGARILAEVEPTALERIISNGSLTRNDTYKCKLLLTEIISTNGREKQKWNHLLHVDIVPRRPVIKKKRKPPTDFMLGKIDTPVEGNSKDYDNPPNEKNSGAALTINSQMDLENQADAETEENKGQNDAVIVNQAVLDVSKKSGDRKFVTARALRLARHRKRKDMERQLRKCIEEKQANKQRWMSSTINKRVTEDSSESKVSSSSKEKDKWWQTSDTEAMKKAERIIRGEALRALGVTPEEKLLEEKRKDELKKEKEKKEFMLLKIKLKKAAEKEEERQKQKQQANKYVVKPSKIRVANVTKESKLGLVDCGLSLGEENIEVESPNTVFSDQQLSIENLVSKPKEEFSGYSDDSDMITVYDSEYYDNESDESEDEDKEEHFICAEEVRSETVNEEVSEKLSFEPSLHIIEEEIVHLSEISSMEEEEEEYQEEGEYDDGNEGDGECVIPIQQMTFQRRTAHQAEIPVKPVVQCGDHIVHVLPTGPLRRALIEKRRLEAGGTEDDMRCFKPITPKNIENVTSSVSSIEKDSFTEDLRRLRNERKKKEAEEEKLKESERIMLHDRFNKRRLRVQRRLEAEKDLAEKCKEIQERICAKRIQRWFPLALANHRFSSVLRIQRLFRGHRIRVNYNAGQLMSHKAHLMGEFYERWSWPRECNITSDTGGDEGLSLADVPIMVQRLKKNEIEGHFVVPKGTIGDTGISLISSALALNASITSFTIEANDVTTAGVELLTEALRCHNFRITFLCLKNNPFIGDGGASHVSTLISDFFFVRYAQLSSVSLVGCGIGDAGCRLLADAVRQNKMIRRLDLSSNKFGKDGLQGWTSLISSGGCPLEVASFANNSIGDDACSMLMRAVVSVNGASLRHLNFVSTGFGSKSTAQLCKLFHCSFVTEIVLLDNNKIDWKAAQGLLGAVRRSISPLKEVSMTENPCPDHLAKQITLLSCHGKIRFGESFAVEPQYLPDLNFAPKINLPPVVSSIISTDKKLRKRRSSAVGKSSLKYNAHHHRNKRGSVPQLFVPSLLQARS